jgi:hypothetical protein
MKTVDGYLLDQFIEDFPIEKMVWGTGGES